MVLVFALLNEGDMHTRARNWAYLNCGCRVLSIFIFFIVGATTLFLASPIIFTLLTILEFCEVALAFFLIIAIRNQNRDWCRLWGLGEFVWIIMYALILLWGITSFDLVWGNLIYFLIYVAFRIYHLMFMKSYIDFLAAESGVQQSAFPG